MKILVFFDNYRKNVLKLTYFNTLLLVKMEFNTNIAQWKTIEALLNEKGIRHWNVTDQWDRTAFKDKYKSKPFAMMLLQLHVQFVILVWGNSKFYTIEPRHSINAIALALPSSKKLSVK